jgi:hypothetical protein
MVSDEARLSTPTHFILILHTASNRRWRVGVQGDGGEAEHIWVVVDKHSVNHTVLYLESSETSKVSVSSFSR